MLDTFLEFFRQNLIFAAVTIADKRLVFVRNAFRHTTKVAHFPEEENPFPVNFYGNILAVGECRSVDFYGTAHAQSAGTLGKCRSRRKNVID